MNKPRIADLRNICDPEDMREIGFEYVGVGAKGGATKNSMSLSGIVVVTGGAGFIGSHIAQHVAASGAKVRIVDDLSTGHRENVEELSGDIEFIEGSVADLQSNESSALEGAEVVFHEAAIPSVPRSVENPAQTHIASVDGTFNLLLAAREQKCTAQLFTRPQVLLMAISQHCRKLKTCRLILCRHTRWQTWLVSTIARSLLEYMDSRLFRFVTSTSLVPAGSRLAILGRRLTVYQSLCSMKRPVIFGDGEQSRDFTYIDNVVSANLKAATTTQGFGKVINVATGERITLNQLLAELKDLLGKPDVTADYRGAACWRCST